LITGFLTRLSAAGIAMIMVGAIAMAHWNNGIFMNWGGKQAGEGFEYHLLALGLAIPLILYEMWGLISIFGIRSLESSLNILKSCTSHIRHSNREMCKVKYIYCKIDYCINPHLRKRVKRQGGAQ
jgi:hypothetical protein